VSQNLKIAIVLNTIIAVVGIVLSAIPLFQYGTDMPSSQPPFGILVSGIVFGALGLIGSYMLWNRLRGGVVFTIVINVINLLLSLPGIPFAEGLWLKFTALLGVVLSAAVIYFLVLVRRENKSTTV
jgi:formate/nitrite transporter FocA (FNT family)